MPARPGPERRVLVGGRVVDGTGAPARAGTVVIDGDRIAAVGPSPELPEGAEVLDVGGSVVAPGFIDVHAHDDFAVLVHPDLAYKVAGGVTSVVVGNCGMGAAPRRAAEATAAAFHAGATLPDYDGYGDYLAVLDRHPPSANVAVLVGHGTIRRAAMGPTAGRADGRALATMDELLQEGLDAGCIGLSTGLIYEPGRGAGRDELVRLASAVARSGGLLTCHLRDEGAGLLASLEEILDVAGAAGVPLQVSHLKAAGRDARGLVEPALARLERARAEGLAVGWDQYPYTAGSTVLEAVVASLAGDDAAGLGVLGPEDVVVSSCAGDRTLEGRSVAELARTWEVDQREAAHRVLALDPGTMVVIHFLAEDDVRTVLTHPGTLVGSDGLPTLEGRPHPRLRGSFARVLGTYVRELGLLGLEQAVHRMTGASAAAFGLADRGLVRPGAVADLVVFDPDRIAAPGTYEDPMRDPVGIDRVIVAGRDVVVAGRHTGRRDGRVLRRVQPPPPRAFCEASDPL